MLYELLLWPRAWFRFSAILTALVSVLAFFSVSESRSETSTDTSVVHVLSVEGVINPLSSLYITRGIERANDESADAVVISLDTPGGLESSMREIVQEILGSEVPVIVYVSPAGARAASAGMFITLAAHIAAMAEGTNIGSAHPVSLGGGGDPDPTMAAKVVNDAAALARSIATERSRNTEWAEQAVRESVSITALEAQKIGVIDITAPTLHELLTRIDGKTIATDHASVQLRTAQAQIVEHPMSLPEKLLHTIVDPNIAYLLMSVGFIGILAELYNPGMLFPGLTGVISLLLAFTALGSLPISWSGAALLGLAFLLWGVELQSEGMGILAASGLVAFILGSLMLYRPLEPVSPSLPAIELSPWVIGIMTVAVASFFFFVLKSLVRSKYAPAYIGHGTLIGKHGVVVSSLAPSGTVKIDSEAWTAQLDDESRIVESGRPVVVTGVEGVILNVKEIPENSPRPHSETHA